MTGTDGELNITLPMAEIEAFCRKWQIAEMALFGSVLRADFGPESDVDVLVRYQPGTQHSLKAFLLMCEELERILERPVDIVNRASIDRSANYIRRREILDSARMIYAA